MINPKKYVDLQKFNTMDVKYSEELQYAFSYLLIQIAIYRDKVSNYSIYSEVFQ